MIQTTRFNRDNLADVLKDVAYWLDSDCSFTLPSGTPVYRAKSFYFLDLVISYDYEYGDYHVTIYHEEIKQGIN